MLERFRKKNSIFKQNKKNSVDIGGKTKNYAVIKSLTVSRTMQYDLTVNFSGFFSYQNKILTQLTVSIHSFNLE